MILILGRFQPLHNGHLKVIKDAANADRELVIAIGSAQKKDEKDNPFSASERKIMIEKVLESENIQARISEIPDMTTDDSYVQHVIDRIGGKPKKVITENPWTLRLFKDAGIDVEVTPRYHSISATEIRIRMAHDEEWKAMVPQAVYDYINRINGVSRIKRLYS